VVSSLSKPKDASHRSAPLDGKKPDMELHVCRVSLNKFAEELQSGEGQLRHDVVGDQRFVRILSRTWFKSCDVGAIPGEEIRCAGRWHEGPGCSTQIQPRRLATRGIIQRHDALERRSSDPDGTRDVRTLSLPAPSDQK